MLFRSVAREVALGIPLHEICVARQLDHESWKRIASGTIFKTEVERISTKIEEQIVADEAEHPVLQKLKVAAVKAVETLVSEVTNYEKDEEGATATTRINASKTVLELAGFTKKEEQKIPTVVINISSSKASSLSRPSEIVECPQNVIGVAHAG